jgi:hypothetical protein
MTTSSLLPRLGHWISTAMVFLFFAVLPLSRCEGQQAPKARQSEISESTAKVPKVGQAPDASDPSNMSDAQLEKAIKDHSAKQATQSQPWDASLVKFLTISVLAFGLIVIVIMAVLVSQKSQTGDVLRLFTVPMVIVAAVFLVVTGFSNSQITPVIGLLGTLAGYVMGVQSQKSGQTPPTHKTDKGGTGPA